MVSVIGKPSTQTNNSLILSSRHQDLTKMLDDFRISSSSIAQNGHTNVVIVLELMLTHLNASLEDMQLFAGIEGQEEARRAYPALQEWVTTNSAREALWHAGQVLRAAAVTLRVGHRCCHVRQTWQGALQHRACAFPTLRETPC